MHALLLPSRGSATPVRDDVVDWREYKTYIAPPQKALDEPQHEAAWTQPLKPGKYHLEELNRVKCLRDDQAIDDTQHERNRPEQPQAPRHDLPVEWRHGVPP